MIFAFLIACLIILGCERLSQVVYNNINSKFLRGVLYTAIGVVALASFGAIALITAS